MPPTESRFPSIVDLMSPRLLTSMDVLFQVVVPSVIEVPGLEKHEETYESRGIDLGEETNTYRWGQYVELHPSKLQPWISGILPHGYVGEDWSVFDINGNGLALWAHEMNGGAVEWMGRPLDTLLQVLLSVDKWVVVFEPHFQPVEKVIQCNADECLRRLGHNLSCNTEEGFVAIAPDSNALRG